MHVVRRPEFGRVRCRSPGAKARSSDHEEAHDTAARREEIVQVAVDCLQQVDVVVQVS